MVLWLEGSCVCVRVSHTQHCPLLCFYLDVGVGRLRVGEGQEDSMVFEVRASFYSLLLPLRASSLGRAQDGDCRSVHPEVGGG